MDTVGSYGFQSAARLLSWIALCALCFAVSPLRAGHLPDMAQLTTSDRLGYRCLPEPLEPLARLARAELGADAAPLPQRCIVDVCARLDEAGLATYLRARPTRAQWADYQARYHAQCHGRDWRPIQPRLRVAAAADLCVLEGGEAWQGPQALLLSPEGRERIYPVDWRRRQIIPPARWDSRPGFAIAMQMMPAKRLDWGRPAPRAGTGTRGLWAQRSVRQVGGLRHVGFEAEGCSKRPGTPGLFALSSAPPVTPVPLPGGALHLLAGLGALAVMRRKGLHRRARRA